MEDQAIREQTVYLVRHGSHAYGLNIATSDVDEKGIAVLTDHAYYFGMKSFDQKDSWEDGVDRVVYDVRKFFRLALACNPNIIEVLYTDPQDILKMTEIGELIRHNRDIFLSRAARNSFVGYAISQLKRIRGHKKWIDSPPERPTEKEFTSVHTVSASQTTPWRREFNNHHVTVHPTRNAPVIIEHFDEGGYKRALKKYKDYEGWKKNRNPARFALEEQFGYDTKHAMHLVRLLRMGIEIIRDGQVVVKRPDRDELLDIRAGKFDYEELVAEAEKVIEEIDGLVDKSPLPEKPDHTAAQRLLSMILRETLE